MVSLHKRPKLDSFIVAKLLEAQASSTLQCFLSHCSFKSLAATENGLVVCSLEGFVAYGF